VSVCLLCDSEIIKCRLVRRFPVDWVTVNLSWRAPSLIQVRHTDVLVAVIQDLSNPAARACLGTLHQLPLGPPIVLCTEPTIGNLKHLLGLNADGLLFLGVEEQSLHGLIGRLLRPPWFREVQIQLSIQARLPPILKRGVTLLLEQVVPSPSESIEALGTGRPLFIRSVKQLSKKLGCTPEYLSRTASASRFSISLTIRWITLIRGLMLAAEEDYTWELVAYSMGFGSQSSWGNFVVRLTGMPPSEASQKGVQHWVTCLTTSLSLSTEGVGRSKWSDQEPYNHVKKR